MFQSRVPLRILLCLTIFAPGSMLPRIGHETRAQDRVTWSETFVANIRYDYGSGEHKKNYTPRFLERLEIAVKENQSALALRSGQSWRVVLNGRISRPHDYLGLKEPGTPAYRPPYWPWLVMASGRAAYCAQIEGKWFVVTDGRESRAYDGVDCDSIRFAPNGRGPAFFARRSGRAYLVLEGREYPGYDNAHDFRFSEDGRNFVYFARRGATTFVVYNGKIVAKFRGVKSVSSISRGPYIAYVLRTLRRRRGVFLGSRAVVFKDRLRIASFEHVEQPVLSPTGDLAFFARKWGRRMGMLARGSEVNAWNHERAYSSDIVFSPGGKNMAYKVVWDAGFETMMISGSRISRFAGVAFPAGGRVFAKGSSRSIYIARKGLKSFVVVDGRPEKLYDEIRNSAGLGFPTFDAKGRSYAYQARLGDRWLTVVDGREGDLHEKVGRTRFNPTGIGFAYPARARGKSHLVLNGRRGPAYDFIQSCGYDERGVFQYIARAGGRGFIVRDEKARALSYSVRDCPRRDGDLIQAHIGILNSAGGKREFIAVREKGVLREIQGPRDQDLKSGTGPAVYFDRIEYLDARNGRLYFIARAGAKRYVGLGSRLIGPYDDILSRRLYFGARGDFHALALRDGKLFVIRGKGKP